MELRSPMATEEKIYCSSLAKQAKMETTYVASRLVLITLFLVCIAAIDTAAAARPAFFYTRSRGICTPQYWSSRREAWPRMVPQTSTVSKVFGSGAHERYRSDLTLLESTTRNEYENAFGGVLKQASAALLNSYAREGFPYAPWEVKTLLIEALVSEEAAARQAKEFSIANQGCI